MVSGLSVLLALSSSPSFATVVEGSLTEAVTVDETFVPVLQWDRGPDGQLTGALVVTLPETAEDGEYALTARFAGGAEDTSWVQVLDLVAGQSLLVEEVAPPSPTGQELDVSMRMVRIHADGRPKGAPVRAPYVRWRDGAITDAPTDTTEAGVAPVLEVGIERAALEVFDDQE